MNVLCVQVDSSVTACVARAQKGSVRSSGVWVSGVGWHGGKLFWQVGPSELAGVFSQAARELGCGVSAPVVVVLPPEASSVIRVEVPGNAGRRALEAAAAAEALRAQESLGEPVLWCWRRVRPGEIAVYLAKRQVVAAVHGAAAAARFRKCVVCPVQEVVAGAVSHWGQGGDGCVVVDSVGDSWCVYCVRGVVLGWERVPRHEQQALPAVVRRVASVHGGASILAMAGRGADGGLAIMLRGALGVGVELLSYAGVAHDVAVPASASWALLRSGPLPWSAPHLVSFPGAGRTRTAPGKKESSTVAAAVGLAAAAVFAGYWAVRERTLAAELDSVRRERAAVASQSAAARIEQRKLMEERAALEERLSGTRWVETMRAIQFSTPEGVRLESFQVGGGRVSISGVAERFDAVAEMRRRLERQGVFREVLLGSVRSSGDGMVSFTLTARWALADSSEEVGGGRQRGGGAVDGRPVRRGFLPAR